MITKRYHFAQIDSTNKKAKEMAEDGCPQGALITASAQSDGVGRRGRSWSSEEEAGIYMTMVLRPEIEPDQASMLTLVTAVSVAKAIEEQLPEECKLYIKWPNDIVLNKKKVCGILTELSLKNKEIDYVVIGIGINVTNKHFLEEIRETASSLLLETGRTIDKEILIHRTWEIFAIYYQQFLHTRNLEFIMSEYEERLVNIEKTVQVLDPVGEYTGIAKGITKTGELLVETEADIKQVSSGEVSVRGIYGYV